MADSDTATVAVRVDKSIKREWENRVSESQDYGSLSHLVRTAVQKEIRDEYSVADTTTTDSGESGSDPEMLDAVESLQGQIASVQAQMDEIQKDTQSEAAYELEQVLLELLPAVPEPESNELLTPHGPDLSSVAVTARDIADRIGANRDRVSGACDRLADETGYIRKAVNEDTGTAYYWREE
jgi:Arc/MetJ-type ribon-helix-helix transcriptional regulator